MASWYCYKKRVSLKCILKQKSKLQDIVIAHGLTEEIENLACLLAILFFFFLNKNENKIMTGKTKALLLQCPPLPSFNVCSCFS